MASASDQEAKLHNLTYAMHIVVVVMKSKKHDRESKRKIARAAFKEAAQSNEWGDLAASIAMHDREYQDRKCQRLANRMHVASVAGDTDKALKYAYALIRRIWMLEHGVRERDIPSLHGEMKTTPREFDALFVSQPIEARFVPTWMRSKAKITDTQPVAKLLKYVSETPAFFVNKEDGKVMSQIDQDSLFGATGSTDRIRIGTTVLISKNYVNDRRLILYPFTIHPKNEEGKIVGIVFVNRLWTPIPNTKDLEDPIFSIPKSSQKHTIPFMQDKYWFVIDPNKSIGVGVTLTITPKDSRIVELSSKNNIVEEVASYLNTSIIRYFPCKINLPAPSSKTSLVKLLQYRVKYETDKKIPFYIDYFFLSTSYAYECREIRLIIPFDLKAFKRLKA